MQNRLVFFVVVIAVILAIAGFLLISFLTRGGDPPVDDPGAGDVADGTLPDSGLPVGVPVQIDGTTVYLRTLPERAVTISQAPPIVEPTVADVLPTTVPTEAVVEPTVPVAQPSAAAPVVGTDRVIFIDYVVQAGDTLYSIADKQATSIELMAVHNISAEDLVPGTTLRLPVGNPAACSGASVYVVRPGDTVFSIAKRYNTTTQAIASANGLAADFRINVAQVLCIP